MSNKKVIALSGEEKTINKDKEVLLALDELQEAADNKTPLTGKLLAVEKVDENNLAIAVVVYKGIKVLIPFKMFIPETMAAAPDVRGSEIILRRRLNSEVDFMVLKVDHDQDVAVGNRLDAMKQKEQEMWFKKDQDGEWLLSDGSVVEARIVTVSKSWIIIEIFGQEHRILAKDISYRRVFDLANYYKVGDITLVQLTNVVRNTTTGKVSIEISIKEAYGDPTKLNIDKYAENSIHVGKVTMIDRFGYYVSLMTEAEVLCRVGTSVRPPLINSSVTVLIREVDKEKGRLYGTIIDVSDI